MLNDYSVIPLLLRRVFRLFLVFLSINQDALNILPNEFFYSFIEIYFMFHNLPKMYSSVDVSILLENCATITII